MARVKISKYVPKHSIMHIPALMQVVQDYLQFEEAEEVYKYFRTKEPQRPLFLRSKEFIAGKNNRFVYNGSLTVGNITSWYIQLESGHQPSAELIHRLLEWNDSSRFFYLQCLKCDKYNQIKTTTVDAWEFVDDHSDTMELRDVPRLHAYTENTHYTPEYYDICDCELRERGVEILTVLVSDEEYDSALDRTWW